jgi:hypothetical protein
MTKVVHMCGSGMVRASALHAGATMVCPPFNAALASVAERVGNHAANVAAHHPACRDVPPAKEKYTAAPPPGESITQNGNESIGQANGLPKGGSKGGNQNRPGENPKGPIEPSNPGPGDIVAKVRKSETNEPGAKSFN